MSWRHCLHAPHFCGSTRWWSQTIGRQIWTPIIPSNRVHMKTPTMHPLTWGLPSSTTPGNWCTTWPPSWDGSSPRVSRGRQECSWAGSDFEWTIEFSERDIDDTTQIDWERVILEEEVEKLKSTIDSKVMPLIVRPPVISPLLWKSFLYQSFQEAVKSMTWVKIANSLESDFLELILFYFGK